MTVPARVSLITLGVEDLERAVAFYEALGWERSPASVEGEVAFFHMTGSQLALWSRTSLAADAGLEPGAVPGFRGISLAINVEDPKDVARILQEAVAAGGRLLRASSTADWGGTTGYFADPDGHVWEVAHNPFFLLDADGVMQLPR
jgi:hypothetical protein